MKKHIFFIWFFCALCVSLKAQVTSVSSGSWDDPNNWNPIGVPDPASDNITVSHEMTISGDRTWSVWSGTRSVSINTNGKIEVFGNLTIQGASADFTVNGGELEVAGTMTIQNGGAELKVVAGRLDVGIGQVNFGSQITVSAGANADFTTLNIGDNSTAIYLNNGTTTITGDLNYNGPVTNNGSFEATNVTGGGSSNSVFTNNGSVEVNEDITLPSSSKYFTTQGSSTIVRQDVNIAANENIVIGDSNAPPAYTDVLIKGDLISTGSGDILVNQNGRLAVYGDITASGGGTYLRIENGGQGYVQGSIDFSGGTGNTIDNKNTVVGFIGLYVDGDVLFSEFDGFVGGESRGTQSGSNSGYNSSSDLPGENDDFQTWLGTLEDSPLASVLPIELQSFEAWVQDDRVQLVWTTSTETNNEYFEIQRSQDGVLFETVAKIDGAGNSLTKISYDHNDLPPHSGLWYYRLKQTDYDGQFEIFEIHAVQLIRTNVGVSVFPNPTSNFINWRGVKVIDAALVSLEGQIMKRKADNEVFDKINISDIPSGAYVLRLVSKTGEYHVKRIVIR